jgi:hypothetical protein
MHKFLDKELCRSSRHNMAMRRIGARVDGLSERTIRVVASRVLADPCIHEHSCLRCALHWPDPAQRDRIAEIRDNLTARIAEANREGWLGEAEGLKISLAGAEDKLAQIDRRTRTPAPVGLGMPALSRDTTIK